MFKEAHHFLTLPMAGYHGFHGWDQLCLLPNWSVHCIDPAGIR